MYKAPRVDVELLCDNSVMDAIIDRFGPDVQTYAGGSVRTSVLLKKLL